MRSCSSHILHSKGLINTTVFKQGLLIHSKPSVNRERTEIAQAAVVAQYRRRGRRRAAVKWGNLPVQSDAHEPCPRLCIAASVGRVDVGGRRQQNFSNRAGMAHEWPRPPGRRRCIVPQSRSHGSRPVYSTPRNPICEWIGSPPSIGQWVFSSAPSHARPPSVVPSARTEWYHAGIYVNKET